MAGRWRGGRRWWLLAVIGVLLFLGGLVAVGIEEEYGSGLDFSLDSRPDGVVVVYESTEQEPAPREVFRGSEDEAMEFVEQRRESRENTVLPALVAAVGAVVLVVGLIGWRRDATADPP